MSQTPDSAARDARRDGQPCAAHPQLTASGETTADYFSTDHLHDDLKGHSVRGGAVTVGGQAVGFLLRLGSTAILARLLTPADYGLIAMATAVTGFVEMFKDAGLSVATVQRAEINHRQVSTLFWINLGLSVALTLLLAALAPGIAWFYDEPGLIWITLALAATFILGGLTIQHTALLQRQMRFGMLALVQIVSQAVGIAVAITAAFLGARYWALVAMIGASAAANALLVWTFCAWRPGLPRLGTGVRQMLTFGGNLTGFSFINYFIRNADKVLLGRYCGPSPLGLYARAYALLLLPLSQVFAPVSAVAVPALSRLQHDPVRFRQYYCSAVGALAYVATPLIVITVLFAEEFVVLILGRQWLGAVPIFVTLAIGSIFQPIAGTTGWLFISLGRVDGLLRWTACVAPLFLLGYGVGLRWGPIGVAAAFSICAILNTVGSLIYACLYAPLSPIEILRAVQRPYLVAGALFLLLLPLGLCPTRLHPALLLTCAAAVTALTYATSLAISLRMRSELAGILGGIFQERDSRLRVLGLLRGRV